MYTDEQFITAIEVAVQERGEGFRYKDAYAEQYAEEGGCEYTVDGQGACIIGKAIQIMTGEPYSGYNSPADEALFEVPFRAVSMRLRRAAVAAQRVQDDNGTWGEALKEFRTTYGKYSPRPAGAESTPVEL